MKNTRKFLCWLACLVLLVSLLSGCSGSEDTSVNIAMPCSTDGLTLERAGLYTGSFSGITVYEFLYEDVADAVEKLTKDKLNRSCHLAYVTADDYKAHFEGDSRFCIVLVDSFHADGSIYGLWVARQDWMDSCPNTFKKAVKGLLLAMNYRAANCQITLAQAKEDIKDDSAPVGTTEEKRSPVTSSEYAHEYTDVMHYIAIYARQATAAVLAEPEAAYISGSQMQDRCAQIPAELEALLGKNVDDAVDFSAVAAANLEKKADAGGADAPVFVIVALSLAALLAIVVIFATVRGFLRETGQYRQDKEKKNA